MLKNNYNFGIKIAITVTAVFFIVFGMFRHFAEMMGGRIIWGEVVLAVFFLILIGLLLAFMKKIVSLMLLSLADKIRPVFLQKMISLGLMVAFWVFVIVPFILATFMLHHPKIGDRYDPQSALGLPFEKIILRTQDRFRLDGWFIPAQSDKTVIIGHGSGANKSNFLGVVDYWHDLGFNVMIFDFRAHGQSQGHTTSLGYKERLDIKAAVDHLYDRSDIDREKIIGYGVSFGGGAMIHAAAEDPRLKAVIIDSAYADLVPMALDAVQRIGLIPSVLVAPITTIGLWISNTYNGFDLVAYSPQRSVSQIRQPILLLHGKKDELVPWQETEKLFARANEPKFLRYFETEGHYTTMNEPAYRLTIVEFLNRVGIAP